MQAPQNRQVARLVGGQVRVGRAQQEGLVALVAPALEESRRFGVGARHDDARDPHDVELQAGRVEPLDLLVFGDEDLAALVTALLGPGLLILDVVAGHADLDEAADQVAHVRVTTVARVGVGDDERTEVDFRRRPSLLVGHARPRVVLVPVGGQQGANEHRGLVRHLAQRVARQIGAGILVERALGRRRPAAEVDALDAHSLHRDRLAGRIRTERRDLPALGEELSQARVERLGRAARDGVVGLQRALLLRDVSRRVEADDAVEPGARDPLARRRDLPIE